MNEPSSTVEQAALRWSIGALAASALCVLLGYSVADPDLWGHLRFGLDMLRDGRLTETDPYSYLTEGLRWINHEWLAELSFALAWTAAGPTGLVLLKGTVAAATLALICAPLLARGASLPHVALALLLLCLPLFTPFFAQVRPQIFTFLFFAATALIVRTADAGAYRWLWAAPPVIALWTNFHGGVLAGVGLLGLWGALHAAFHWEARWKLFWPLLCVPLAMLVNPYGADLPFFLLATATVPRPEIQDWQPLIPASRYGFAYLVVVASLAVSLAWSREPRRRVLLALCALLALLPLMAVRHLALFCIAATIFAGEHVWGAWNARFAAGARRGPRASPWLALVPALAALALLFGAASRGVFTRVHITLPFPAAAVELLARSGASGRLVTDFGWGQYVLWHLGPRIQVNMDGRRETVYAPRIYEQYLAFHFGRRDWDAVLHETPADFVLVRRGRPIHNLMKLNPDWQPVFEDAHSALFVNAASSAGAAVTRAAAAFEATPRGGAFP